MDPRDDERVGLAIGIGDQVGAGGFRRDARRRPARAVEEQCPRVARDGRGEARDSVGYWLTIRPSTFGSSGEWAVMYAATASTSMSP